MRQTLKKYFIPHAENNYHPHILHTKRAIFYSLFFLSCKVILVIIALSLPIAVFTTPDILSQEARKITMLTNELRAQKSISLLSSNDKLAAAATAKAMDMAQKSYFSHTSPSGETVADFIVKSGYRYVVVGENLAIGYATAEEVVAAWKKSPTHLANLVDKDYVDLGVSLEVGDFKGQTSVFAVQHFAEPVNLTVSAAARVVAPAAKAAANGVLVGQPFWENPTQKYLRAKEISSVNNIFGLSRNIFLFAIMFFSLALALSVFIEFKKQNPNIIAQTTGLVGLLAVLFLV